MPASPAPSAVRGASAAPPMSARAPGLEPPPAACASRTAEGAPPAPGVSVLIMAAGFAGPVGAGRTDPRSEGPIAAADSSGPLDEEVLALVRACTGADPFLCSPSDDPLDAVAALTPSADAVLLLGPAAVLPEAPAGQRLVTFDVESLAAPDGLDRLVAALLSAQHPPRARIVALVGTRGGLGTSTFLLHLARACTVAGARVSLLDADPAGGLGLLIGNDVVPGLRWSDLPADEAAFRPDRLVPVLPTWLGMPVLTGDARGGIPDRSCLVPALEALAAHHDLVLVDLPRGIDLPPGALTLLVTALDLRAALAAEALAARYRTRESGSVAMAVRLVGEDLVLDELEIMTRAPVIATIPHDRAVTQRVARGDDPTRGRGATRRAARALAAELVGADRPW